MNDTAKVLIQTVGKVAIVWIIMSSEVWPEVIKLLKSIF